MEETSVEDAPAEAEAREAEKGEPSKAEGRIERTVKEPDLEHSPTDRKRYSRQLHAASKGS